MSKGFRKRRRQEDSSAMVSEIDVVTPERNFIEQKLIDFRHWISDNPSRFRILLWSLISLFVFILGIYIISSFRAESHASTFFDLLAKYDTANELFSTKEGKKESLIKIADEALSLCETSMATAPASNGCLLAASIYTDYDQKASALKAFSRFSEIMGSQDMGFMGTYYAGYSAEGNGDFSAAKVFWERLEPAAKSMNREDFLLFHVGRIYYYEGQNSKAMESFTKILSNHKQSPLLNDARYYLRLAALAQSGQPSQK